MLFKKYIYTNAQLCFIVTCLYAYAEICYFIYFLQQANSWIDYDTGTEAAYSFSSTLTLVNRVIVAERDGKMNFDRLSRVRFGLSILANFGQLSELIGRNAVGDTGKWLTVRQNCLK